MITLNLFFFPGSTSLSFRHRHRHRQHSRRRRTPAIVKFSSNDQDCNFRTVFSSRRRSLISAKANTTGSLDDKDIHSLLQVLPCDLHNNVLSKSKNAQLLEVILDVGRLPEARYHGKSRKRHYLRETELGINGRVRTCSK